MPIYEYKCQQCKSVFEVTQKFSDKPLSKCECGGKVVRVFHPAGIIFKGSGFYTTDYAKKKGIEDKTSAIGQKAEGKSEEKPKETAAKNEKKNDTKPEKKPVKTP